MGGAPSTTHSTQVSEPSEWTKQQLGPLYQGARSIARSSKYTPFRGQRIEGFSADEREAKEGIRGMYDAGPRPELDWGMGQNKDSVALSQEAAGIGRGIGKFDQEAFDRYSSPYFENVLDIQKRNARQEALMAQSAIGARQAMQGGYGSMRHGVLQAELGRSTQQGLADIDAKGHQQAWENALAAHGKDQQAEIAGGQLVLSSGDALRDAASQAMDFADIQQAQAFERLAALEASGMSQRDMSQAVRDMAYADFVEKRDWQKSNYSWLSSILSGFPASFNTINTQPGPSTAGQLAGLAALGVGAAGAYNQS
jgi:hypothetical protein